MKVASVAIVILGVALAVAGALGEGLDATGVVILVLLVGCGALAIGVVSRTGGPAFGPSRCPACGGVVSRNMPRCKHCGAPMPPPG